MLRSPRSEPIFFKRIGEVRLRSQISHFSKRGLAVDASTVAFHLRELCEELPPWFPVPEPRGAAFDAAVAVPDSTT